ncbi:DUF7619 domain-containing protein [Reichenbachiella versicolor]|uniref:DUF7619 domain-containing protein n=1 Tax=Reichenbachiella versicolor TaxID=1821036 RepID=UPI000D6DE637|nr:DUF11 domain-containing protein [Reichenbachiella versicolor]
MKKFTLLAMLIVMSILTHAQVINFPDANFKNKLLSIGGIDTNNDLEITQQEAELVTSLNLRNSGISDLTGIEYFINVETINLDKNNIVDADFSGNTELVKLDISFNSNIKSLNVENNAKLKELSIGRSRNYLYDGPTELDFTNNPLLERLFVVYCDVTNLDLSNNTALITLGIECDRLQGLDFSNNTALRWLSINYSNINNWSQPLDLTPLTKLEQLRIAGNGLTEIDLSQNTQLTTFHAENNNLEFLDLSNNPKIGTLRLDRNELTSIDFSALNELGFLSIGDNKLETLDLRNTSVQSLNFSNNPNITRALLTGLNFRADQPHFASCPSLDFICADAAYIPQIQDRFNNPNYTACTVSSSCGTDYYPVTGTVRYDLDNDGCDVNDKGFTDAQFILSNQTTGDILQVFPLNTGEYSAALQEGDYFMFSNLQNPLYFKIDPSPFPPAVISFPQNGPSVTKDFCVSANGFFNDLEIMIVPVNQARPGFSAEYVVTYKNRGTTTQSGTVTFTYMNDVLQYTSASPGPSAIFGDKITWSFSDLTPLESRSITLTFQVNTPLDNPAVNGGDILAFETKVAANNDSSPSNNVAVLNQTVVNSYDPNDKTCLEGEILEPKNVGNYLHYLIRFENEGTADAINIRITDDIDTTKLDIATFVPLHASHPYRTEVHNEKEIEFIFDDIHLPFNDADNDGYVLFKIKSKSDLVLNDEIDNGASIYFDFNPPVITDVETVTVKEKEDEEELPEFSDFFVLSPNPTSGVMYLRYKEPKVAKFIQFISIHDLFGNVVGYFPGTTQIFNVSYLFPNNYIMRVHTTKAVFATQFIKTK